MAQVVKPNAGHQSDAAVTMVDLVAPDSGGDKEGFERSGVVAVIDGTAGRGGEDEPRIRPPGTVRLHVSSSTWQRTPCGHKLGCYHPSPQSTRTGRLTADMLDAVLHRAARLAVDAVTPDLGQSHRR